MNHTQNLLAALAHIEQAMNCESTVAELAPHLTREQAVFLADHAEWCRELIAARPPIQPAKEWRTPTEVRLAVANNLKARSEQSIRRNRHGRPVR